MFIGKETLHPVGFDFRKHYLTSPPEVLNMVSFVGIKTADTGAAQHYGPARQSGTQLDHSTTNKMKMLVSEK